MNQMAQHIENLIQHSPWLAFGAVFVGGLLTASNPCVLAMIPLSVAYVGGAEAGTNWRRALGLSLAMVFGLSLTFAVLGALAGTVGRAVGGSRHVWNWVVAAVCLLMGLHLMDVVSLPIPALARTPPGARGALGAFLLGILFGFVSTPCAGPILVVLLAYLAAHDASPVYGGLLLLAYALGHSALIVIAGTSMGIARGLIASDRFRKSVTVLKRVAGGIIAAVGVYFTLQAV
jgi:cytochrome c biogenesis protein CcdA